MIQSRKTGSKIHANETVSGIKRVARRVDEAVGRAFAQPSFNVAVA